MKVLLALAVLFGAAAWAIRKWAATRESAAVVATKAIMKAIADLADRIEEVEKNTGRPCAFLDGKIPEHVEKWMRLELETLDRRRR